MPISRREFLPLLGLAPLGLYLEGCDRCYGVSCKRWDSVERCLHNRSWRRKSEIQAPFSLEQMKDLDLNARERVYLNLLRQTFNNPESVFTPADCTSLGFPLDEATSNQIIPQVLDKAEIARYGLILEDLLNKRESGQSSHPETPFTCIERLYFYYTESIFRKVEGNKYNKQKYTAAEIGHKLILQLSIQQDLRIYDDLRWVLAASWLPILGSFEAKIRESSDYELAGWIENGYVGVIH